MSADLCQLSASTLARRIRNGDLSPVDAVEAHLERIGERNDTVNAYVTVLEREAREAAREAERAVERGDDLGKLHGVPIALKDLFSLKAGVRNTFGSRLFADYVPNESAIIVERLEAEGAIVLGKTNVPEFAVGPITDNEVVGPTGTPFDLDRTAGGSSGGSAAAVADGLAPIATGSDGGGSIRIPASFCGVYGLKPSFGLVPYVRGWRPDAFLRAKPYFDAGPITRTVEDAALMLDVMAGPHPEDPFTHRPVEDDYVAAVDRDVSDLDVAFSPTLGGFPVDDDVDAVVREAVDDLGQTVGSVTELELDFGDAGEISELFTDWVRILYRTLLRNYGERFGTDPFGSDRDRLRDVVVETIVEGEDLSTVEYKRTDRARTRVFEEFQRILGEYDLVLSPTVGTTSFEPDSPPQTVGGRDVEPLRGWLLTQPINMSGHPAASMPCGFVDGLPVGLQVIGRRFDEATVLAASAAFERRNPWHDAYPFVQEG